MSTIPPEAKQAMTAVVAAMGGDDYNYYSDFSTTVASSGRARIIVYFQSSGSSSSKTEKLRSSLERSLNKQKYTVVVQNNQIDVLINGTKKKIRINVKPPVGGTYSI